MEIKQVLKLILPGYELSKKIYYRYKIAVFLDRKGFSKIAEWCSYRIYRKYNCCISHKAQIGKNIEFPHPIGVVIGAGAQIGDNCVIYQNVTLGRKDRNIDEYPIIGNNVIIYCNSTIIGNISIGDNSIIGCNSVILKSIENNSRCVGVVK